MRYSPQPFPAHRYFPGQTPHPTRDPGGHSYGHFPPHTVAPLDPAAWASCGEYLYGIDLFNESDYWEAHEAFEGLWVAAGRRTAPGLALQGLIQIAVVQLKWRQGHTHAAHTLTDEGFAKLPATGTWLGIDNDRLHEEIDDCLAGRSRRTPIIELDLGRAS